MADDDLQLTVPDLDGIKAWASSTAGKATIATVLILIPLILGLFLRLQPLTYNNLDRAATQSADQQLIQQFATQIQLNDSGIQPSSVQQQARIQLQRYKQTQPDAYQEQRQQAKQRLTDHFQKPDGEPYLLAIDPYYYWRQTQNVLDHGYGADETRNGTMWNTHQLAPLGQPQQITELHPLLAAGLGQALSNVFDTTPYMVFFTLPAVIASLAVIPAFFLGRRHGGSLGGFITAAIVATHQVFVSRSVAGFSDTDAYNITLPLFIFWFTVETFTATTRKRRWTYGALTTVFIGILAKTWLAWWLTYIFVITTALAVFGQDLLRQAWQAWQNTDLSLDTLKDDVQWTHPALALAIIIGGAITAGIARGFNAVFGLVGNVLSNLQLDAAVGGNLWPNVFTTVAELGDTNFSGIVSTLGSPVLFYLSMLGVLLLFLPSKIETTMQRKVYYGWFGASAAVFAMPFLFETAVFTSVFFFALPIIAGYTITIFEDNERVSIAFPIFLSVWIISLLVASVRGTRFVMILMPAYAIALGTLLGWAFKKTARYAWNADSRDTTYATSILAGIILIISLLIPLVTSVQGAAAGQRLPQMNDAWYNSLETIQNESTDDAIITSWWDFGHWFKQVADRPVTFDGATQNTPNAHWVGRALQTNDPDEAKSTLRMLHCGNRKGFNELRSYKHGSNTPEANLDTKQTLDEALTRNSQTQAVSYYENQGLTTEEAQSVANLTHCNPPQNYFITSSDMVGKGSVWGHFGLWDFGRAYALQTRDAANPQETIDRYAENIDVSREEAREYYLNIADLNTQRQRNQWVADYPQYATQTMRSCETTNTSITCDIGLNLGQQRQRRLELESVTAPINNPRDATYTVGVYNTQTDFRQGQQTWQPASVSVGDGNELTTTTADNQTRVGLGVLLHNGENGWEALLASPELTTSMFTRLYFLDGAYTDDFDLVTDRQSSITGSRIKVWEPTLSQ
jgi:dolichyl-diphosphooligosaccharide--protein glycosyltransferase